MYDAPGIGLAAIQIGTAKRVVTIDLAKKEEPKDPQVFINPEIVWSSAEKATYEEGCLSIPEFYDEVERPAQVKVRYLDLEGKSLRDRGQRTARHLPAARDRPSQRYLVHRSPVQAQARPRDQEVRQGGQAGGGNCLKSASWSDMPLRLVFMGTPDFAVPTLVEIVGRGHERRGGLHPRAQARRPAGMELMPSPVEREARRARAAGADSRDLADRGCRAHGAWPWRGGRDRRRLWAHPAEADPGSVSARMLQSARLAAAALAGRRADQPRDHGRRCGDRRDGDEDGGRSRHRPDRDGRAGGNREATRPQASCRIGSPASAPI